MGMEFPNIAAEADDSHRAHFPMGLLFPSATGTKRGLNVCSLDLTIGAVSRLNEKKSERGIWGRQGARNPNELPRRILLAYIDMDHSPLIL
jgi:hypothetical protein